VTTSLDSDGTPASGTCSCCPVRSTGMPGDVARDLLNDGCERSDVALVCERPIRDDEPITRTTAGELARHVGGTERADTPFSNLSVLVVRR